MTDNTHQNEDKKKQEYIIAIPSTKEEVEQKPLIWIESRDGNFGYYSMFLYMLIKSQKLYTVVEIGVDAGYSTRFLVRAVKELGKGKVYSIDKKYKADTEIFFKEYWEFIQGDSVRTGKEWKQDKIQMIFIDGDHSFMGVYRDLEAWYPHIEKNGYIIMHDCTPSSEVEKAYVIFFQDKNVDKIVFPGKPMELAIIKKLED